MPLITSVNYDPAVRVIKSLTGTVLINAFDIVNLRLTFTVPANGKILVRMDTGTENISYLPILAVLSGLTILVKKTPKSGGFINGFSQIEMYAVVSGLAPGAILTLDAAYGTRSGNTGQVYYGGPDVMDATTGGAFSFEIWTA